MESKIENKSDFQSYLDNSMTEIDPILEIVLKEWLQESKEASRQTLSFAKVFAESCFGGKRIRGALVKLGYELSGGEPTPEIIKAAVAFEIFQTAILAHDDIIDKSPLRRGKPTIYHALGGNHRGVSHTICLGDIGFFLAVRLLASLNFQEDRKVTALKSFSQTVLHTVLGEMMDIELPYLKEKRVEDDALSIFELKTAWYTITGPLHLGAILAGATDGFLVSLTIFGQNLGIAFQIHDDILGVFGDENILGKSVSSDIEEGKNTLLIIHALSKANPDQKKVLEQFYGMKEVGSEKFEQIRQIFIETGALDYARFRANSYISKARKAITEISKNKDTVFLLNQLVTYLSERKK